MANIEWNESRAANLYHIYVKNVKDDTEPLTLIKSVYEGYVAKKRLFWMAKELQCMGNLRVERTNTLNRCKVGRSAEFAELRSKSATDSKRKIWTGKESNII